MGAEILNPNLGEIRYFDDLKYALFYLSSHTNCKGTEDEVPQSEVFLKRHFEVIGQYGILEAMLELTTSNAISDIERVKSGELNPSPERETSSMLAATAVFANHLLMLLDNESPMVSDDGWREIASKGLDTLLMDIFVSTETIERDGRHFMITDKTAFKELCLNLLESRKDFKGFQVKQKKHKYPYKKMKRKYPHLLWHINKMERESHGKSQRFLDMVNPLFEEAIRDKLRFVTENVEGEALIPLVNWYIRPSMGEIDHYESLIENFSPFLYITNEQHTRALLEYEKHRSTKLKNHAIKIKPNEILVELLNFAQNAKEHHLKMGDKPFLVDAETNVSNWIDDVYGLMLSLDRFSRELRKVVPAKGEEVLVPSHIDKSCKIASSPEERAIKSSVVMKKDGGAIAVCNLLGPYDKRQPLEIFRRQLYKQLAIPIEFAPLDIRAMIERVMARGRTFVQIIGESIKELNGPITVVTHTEFIRSVERALGIEVQDQRNFPYGEGIRIFLKDGELTCERTHKDEDQSTKANKYVQQQIIFHIVNAILNPKFKDQ